MVILYVISISSMTVILVNFKEYPIFGVIFIVKLHDGIHGQLQRHETVLRFVAWLQRLVGALLVGECRLLFKLFLVGCFVEYFADYGVAHECYCAGANPNHLIGIVAVVDPHNLCKFDGGNLRNWVEVLQFEDSITPSIWDWIHNLSIHLPKLSQQLLSFCKASIHSIIRYLSVWPHLY